MSLPRRVNVVEVGPRDGLQNEQAAIPVDVKVSLVERLVDAGVRAIEVGSFVSPKWVPQMADSAEVFARIRRQPGVRYCALTPNLKGFEAALAAGAGEVEIFAAASEAFSRRNINCSVAESIERFAPVAQAARAHGLRLRAAVSTAFGCPYQGEVPLEAVLDVTRRLADLGCDEISIADTIGTGTAGQVRRTFEAAAAIVPMASLSGHFHDTYGQALANVYAALETGVTTFDASVAGLGGCPYARGATGNVATEDVLYLLHGLGIDTGIDLDAVVDIGQWISAQLGRRAHARAGNALAARRAAQAEPEAHGA